MISTDLIEQTVELTRALQEHSTTLQTHKKRQQQHELEHMINSNQNKNTLIQITDQTFQSKHPERTTEQLTHILDIQKIPQFFNILERTILLDFQSFNNYLPNVSIPLIKNKIRTKTTNIILPTKPELLQIHLNEHHESGIHININYLNKTLLKKQNTQHRLTTYLTALQLTEIKMISIKISTIYSQISTITQHKTISTLIEHLELLYHTTKQTHFTHKNNTKIPKFIYLNIKKYQNLWITIKYFIKTLNLPELEHIKTNIALQTYLPNSISTQHQITKWTQEQITTNKTPITIRIIKNTNLKIKQINTNLHK